MDQFRDFLITDRTESDTIRVKYLASLWGPRPGQWRGTKEELAEWNTNLKGAYNAYDLNRVTLAACCLLTRIKENGYSVPENIFPAYAVSVSVNPPGSGKAQGAIFYEGDEATVRAEAIGTSRFLGWEENGKTVSESPVYTFIPKGDTALTARFEAEWAMETSIVGMGRIGRAILGKGMEDDGVYPA